MTDQEINSYRDLRVWREAMSLAASVYILTRGFPREELFGLTSQSRRAANIAEGHGREQTGSFIQFLRIAQGSLKELETHILLALQIGLAEVGEVQPVINQCESVGKMLRLLIRSLQKRTP